MTEPRTKGRLMLLLVAGVFLGPLVLSFVLYFFGSGWRPWGSAEHGVLLTPPRIIAESSSAPRSETSLSVFRGKWSLVHVGGAHCDETCRETLYATRQVRRSLGRDLPRVQRIYCATEERGALAFFAAEHPELIVLDPDESTTTSLREAVGDFAAGDVYLVDPLGNLMMHFPKETGMQGMQKDLKRLLRVSRIG
jgi:hypothetical protein